MRLIQKKSICFASLLRTLLSIGGTAMFLMFFVGNAEAFNDQIDLYIGKTYTLTRGNADICLKKASPKLTTNGKFIAINGRHGGFNTESIAPVVEPNNLPGLGKNCRSIMQDSVSSAKGQLKFISEERLECGDADSPDVKSHQVRTLKLSGNQVSLSYEDLSGFSKSYQCVWLRN